MSISGLRAKFTAYGTIAITILPNTNTKLGHGHGYWWSKDTLI